jgi:NitT/TauT family transport system permease protein
MKVAPRMRVIGLPMLFFVVVIGGWELVVRAFDVPEFLLPAPSDVVASFSGELNELWPHTRTTALEAILGYVIGNGMALVLAALMAEFKTLERGLYPYVIGLRSLPIVAVAPLLILWLGFTIWPIVAAAALICFFPTLVNGIEGFKSTDETTLELMRGLHSGRLRLFTKVKVFNALPYIFAALKISVASALVGAVVGEWIGSSEGLGYLTILANNYVDTLLLFRAIVLIGLIGILWFMLVSFIEKRVLSWNRPTT